MNDEQHVEELIHQEQALAPRVTSEDLDANIKHVEYVVHITHSGAVLRWCVITTTNGFAVTGEPSAAVSIENDRSVIGEQVAYENARSKMWPLMGYLLKEKLHAEKEKNDLVASLGEDDCEGCKI